MPKIIRIEGVFVPETLEEARQIVPDCDEEQFRKWVDELAIELRFVDVYELNSVPPVVVMRGKTEKPRYAKLGKVKFVELVIEWTEEDVETGENVVKSQSFYLPEYYLDVNSAWRLIMYVSRAVEAYVPGVVEAHFSLRDAIELVQKGETSLKSACWVDEDSVTDVRVRIGRDSFVGWFLTPDSSYELVLQYVKIPNDILPTDVKPRSSFHRWMWIIRPANIDPGFEGHIYVQLEPGKKAPPLAIAEGERILQVRFFKLSEPVKGYRGQWQKT